VHTGAKATTTKEWQAWCRQVPLQVQSLIDALVSPPSHLNDERRHAQHHPEIKFVPRAAQYIATDSLVFSVIFLGRYLAGLPPAEQAHMLLPQQMLLLFATCMVLADKFSNDDAYDDLLPAVGIVTGIQPKVLRKKEVEILGSLLNTSSMFVAEAEFESFVYLLEEDPWARLKKEGSLSLLLKTARDHLGVEDLQMQLFSANGPTRTPGFNRSLKAFSNYVRTNRPRPHLPFAVGGAARRASVAATGGQGDAPGNGGSRPAGLFGRANSGGGAADLRRPPAGNDKPQARCPSLPVSISAAISKGAISAPASPTAGGGIRRFDIFGLLGRSRNASKKGSPVGAPRNASAGSPAPGSASGPARGGSLYRYRSGRLEAAEEQRGASSLPGSFSRRASASGGSQYAETTRITVNAAKSKSVTPPPSRGEEPLAEISEEVPERA